MSRSVEQEVEFNLGYFQFEVLTVHQIGDVHLTLQICLVHRKDLGWGYI